MRIITRGLALLLVFAVGNCCRADLIVDIQDVQMQVGTERSVNVYVHNSDGEVNVGAYNLKFNISAPQAGTAGTLEFQPTLDQSNSERSDADYIFSGKTGSNFASVRQDANGNRRQLVQSDDVVGYIGFPGSTVLVGTTPKLVATLEIAHIRSDATPSVFEISLDPSSNFNVFNGGPKTVAIAPQSFATSADNVANGTHFTNFGIVRVTAVPEPSSSLLLLFTLGASAFRRRRCIQA